eukprot:12557063-Alexandrium_andersonii.AAC.1
MGADRRPQGSRAGGPGGARVEAPKRRKSYQLVWRSWRGGAAAGWRLDVRSLSLTQSRAWGRRCRARDRQAGSQLAGAQGVARTQQAG